MAFSAHPALSTVNHLIFGLVPGDGYDVAQDAQLIGYDLQSGSAGSIAFPADGGGAFAILPAGQSNPPPSPVTTLAAGSPTATSILLSWTAVGANGNQGRASQYDIRYSTSPIDATSWAGATRATGEPAPRPAGEAETFTVPGLAAATRYYFAIKVADEVPNWSGLSNVPSATTLQPPDTTPPAGVDDLAASSPTQTSIRLAWTATGDDGIQGRASGYDLRYATTVIDGTTWPNAIRAEGEPSPANPGAPESFVVTGLSPGTRYHFALRVGDEAGNWSPLSNAASAGTEPAPDTEPPSGIDDLQAVASGHRSALLRWTAPRDDTPGEPVSGYLGRFSAEGLAEETWEEGLIVEGLPDPGEPGAQESFLLEGLAPATTYHVGIRSLDEEGNLSSLASVCEVTTTSAPDTLPPIRTTDLEARAIARTTIEVSWSAPEDRVPDDCVEEPEVDRYEIRFSTFPLDGDGWAAGVSASAPDPASPGVEQRLTIADLIPSTRYYVALRSRDPRGNWSEISNQIEAITLEPEVLPDIVPPAPVADIAARAIAPDRVLLTWLSPSDAGAPGGADHYDIRRARSPVTPESWESATPVLPVVSCRGAGSPESLRVADLEPETTYHFALRAIDDAGNLGPLSESVDATTPPSPDTLPPDRVEDLRVAGLDTVSVLLAWTTPDDDGGQCAAYEMRISTEEIDEESWGGADLVPELPTPGPPGSPASQGIEGLAPSTRYFVALKTSDAAGNWSPVSNVVDLTTDAIPEPPEEDPIDTTPPAAVSNLAATAIDETRIQIAWTAVGDDGLQGQATRYELRRSVSPIDESNWETAIPIAVAMLPAPAGAGETFTVTGLESDTEHHFAIRVADEAGNRSGCSNDAAAQTFLPLDTSPPAAPMGLAAADEGDRVRLAWFPSAEPDFADYALHRRQTGSPDVWTVPGLLSPSFLDTTASPEIEYFYSVTARDVSGNPSSPSAEVAVTLDIADFLPQVSGFHSKVVVRVEEGGETAVARLTWGCGQMARVAGFAVDRSDDGGASWIRRTGALLPPQRQNEFVEPMERPSCLYRVVAVSSRGYELPMPPTPASLSGRTRRHRIDGPFPNPSVGPLRFHFSLATPARVRILAHDVTGRVRTILRDEEATAGEQDWSLSDAAAASLSLPSGVYFLTVEVGGERASRKFILQR
ncbi:MAG: T9SS type A sorting domain-containing protein [Candidatus Eisenbacteria bacterium]|nr:T9SS type A sorting domain-containing protein [Candidatus Eisenbacteria bacterium]